MAWYYGTFGCGCDGRVNVIGPTKDRKWKAKLKFKGFCEECYKKVKDEERMMLLKLAEQIDIDYGLQPLRGSKAQIEWAKTIRAQFVQHFQTYLKTINNSRERERLELFFDELLQRAELSRYWIDRRDWHVKELLNDFAELRIKEEVEELMKPKGMENEMVIEPETKTENDPVEIRVFEHKVVAVYRRHDIFNKVVKSLGYRWNSENLQWVKNVDEKAGKVNDRATELAVKLLSEGIPVSVVGEELHEKIKNQDYKKECHRWVDVREINDVLYFDLSFPFGSNCYEESRKIKGSKYNSKTKTVLIPKNQYLALLDFADVFKFELTKNAKILIELLKRRDKEILSNPELANEPETFSLKDILNSSDEILPDLLDD